MLAVRGSALPDLVGAEAEGACLLVGGEGQLLGVVGHLVGEALHRHVVSLAALGLADLEPDDRCAMVWYVLGDQASGRKGIISAAVGLLCRHAFESLGLSCVYAWIMRPNAASRRVLEKNGFRESGTLRRAAILRGEPVDRVYFDLTPQDLAPPRP